MKFSSKLVPVVVLVAIMAFGFAASASAHECVIGSRSDQGNLMAGTNSNVWQYYTPVTQYAALSAFVTANPAIGQQFGLTPLTQAQIEWAGATALAAGVLPAEFTVFEGRTTLLVAPANGDFKGTPPAYDWHVHDGKGVDHMEINFGAVLAIYAQAMAH